MIKKDSSVVCIAKIVVKADKINAALDVFADLKKLSPQEKGCMRYELHQDAENQLVFTFIDRFKDQKAFEYHCEQDYTKKYFDDVLPKITDSIEISMHHEIDI